MSEQLIPKLLKALQATGYPLELEMAAIAQQKGWTAFHAQEYRDPSTHKLRELDLLLFKNIHDRRIEVRISCKSSISKLNRPGFSGDFIS